MAFPLRSRFFALLARIAAACLIVGTLSGGLVVSCAGDPPSSTSNGNGNGNNPNAPASSAMGQWSPVSGKDTCTKAQHDAFFVVGPDGKKYPTWHAATFTDTTTNKTCTFGHEHGPDPANSAMWGDIKKHFAADANSTGGIPFGYVAEQLASSNTPRTEDHTGYKVAFADGVPRSGKDSNGNDVTVVCNGFVAYNQPTSTSDAFASTLYSVTYAVDCKRGATNAPYPVKAIVSVMAVYGTVRQFTFNDTNGQVTVTQDPVPPTSPSDGSVLGRRVPFDTNVFASAFVAAGATSNYDGLAETWDANVRLLLSDGTTTLASFAPQFRVDDPARYYSTSGTVGLARSIDLCYTGLNAAGTPVDDPTSAAIVRKVRNDAKCAPIAPNGTATSRATRVAFDATNSPFRGCSRAVQFGAETLQNKSSTTTWYSTPFGLNTSTTRTGTSTVKQFVDAEESNAIVLTRTQIVSQSGCDASVHVPN